MTCHASPANASLAVDAHADAHRPGGDAGAQRAHGVGERAEAGLEGRARAGRRGPTGPRWPR